MTRRPLALAAAALLLAAAPVRAAPDEAHRLAAEYMDRAGFEDRLDDAVSALRIPTAKRLEGQGLSPQAATSVTDDVVLAALVSRSPEINQRIEAIVAQRFTTDELHALMEGPSNDAYRSATAQAAACQAEIEAAIADWARHVQEETLARYRLADGFMVRAGLRGALEGNLATIRAGVVERQRADGKTAAEAAAYADGHYLPVFRRHMPDYEARYAAVLMDVFTGPELQALADDAANDARDAARAKFGPLQTRIAALEKAWGREVSSDVLMEMMDAPASPGEAASR